MTLVRFFAFVSGASFLVYAVLCFHSPSMASDFHRFGVDSMRIPTGILEVLGGLGLLVGLRWAPALWMSAAGLSLLMLIAFGLRMRAHDGVAVSIPSFLFTLLNAYILIRAPKVSPFHAQRSA